MVHLRGSQMVELIWKEFEFPDNRGKALNLNSTIGLFWFKRGARLERHRDLV
jgi:hypothetical protein